MRRRLFVHWKLNKAAAIGAGVMCLWGVWSPCDAGNPPGVRVGVNYSLYEQGRYVYEQNCLICHGDRGDGPQAVELGVGAGLDGHAPSVARCSSTRGAV